jgi:hypothetical protein
MLLLLSSRRRRPKASPPRAEEEENTTTTEAKTVKVALRKTRTLRPRKEAEGNDPKATMCIVCAFLHSN